MSAEYYFVPQPESYVITKLAFRFRLTDEEFVGILNAAPTMSTVRAWLETFNMVSQINLADKRAFDGLQALADLDLLSDERVIEIVSAPIQPQERP